MTYIKWKDEVESYLGGMSEEEKKKAFSYFSEMYADMRDAGKSEEEIIAGFGAPYDVALKILGASRESAGAETAVETPVTPPPVTPPPVTPPPSQVPPAHGGEPAPRTNGGAATKQSKMSKLTGGKGWLIALCIVASVLILGLILFLVDVARNGWKIVATYEMQEFVASEQNNKLDLSLSAGKMEVIYFDGDGIEVSYPTSSNFSYVVKEANGTVSVKPKNGFHFFMFGTGKIPTVTVRVPRSQAPELKFSVSAGDATIADMSFTTVNIDVSAGSLTAGNLTCTNFDADISAGNLNFSGITCNSLDMTVSAGNAVVGKLVCDKVNADVSAGSVNLTVGGKKDDYTIKISKSAGKVNGVTEQTGNAAGKLIDLDISAGTVTVNFTE